MKFTATMPVLIRTCDDFYCRSRRERLTLERCLDGYLQANALERRRSACFRCPHGRFNREGYADAGEQEGNSAQLNVR